ncbi:Efflux pump radE [Colletotrichum sp. SAR 10_75]|nr:Efflux pump radE [Colletotrichum sp. SAR 10_75]
MSGNTPKAIEGLAVGKGPEPEKSAEEETPRDPNIVDFNGPNDPEHPLNWSTTRKTTTIVIVSLTALLSAAAAADIMHHFNTTNATLGALMTTIYLLGYAFGPLLIAPLSELHGRAPVFRACAALFALFNVACALAPSFGSLIAFRLLAGVAGSCAGTLGASAIAAMVPRERRGRVMSALRKSTGNEGLRSALDTSKTPGQLFKFAILRPPKMLVSPIIFLMSAYAATVFSYAYLCFTTFPRIFKDQYGFGSGASGLTSIGIGVGFILGLLFVGAVSDPWSAYLTKKNDGVAKPEFRLPTLVIGAVFVPVGLFWYGWSAEYKAHWIVPIMGTALLGIGIVTAYTTTATYLIDAYTVYSASVMAASAILRCLFGALLPLAGSAMFDALGVGWGNSVLGFISLAFLPLPFILFFYGGRIRESKLFKMEF